MSIDPTEEPEMVPEDQPTSQTPISPVTPGLDDAQEEAELLSTANSQVEAEPPQSQDKDKIQISPVAETIQIPAKMPPAVETPISAGPADVPPPAVVPQQQATTTTEATSAAPAIPAAQAPNPFLKVEDLSQLQLAGEPQVSPDGLLITYTVLQSDLAANTARATLWLVPTTPGTNNKSQPPRQLTNEAFHATLPRWSPDGRCLAFVSDRSGLAQIYLLPLNGGEARQVSFLKQGVSDFAWRPDGRALLVQSPWKLEDDQPDFVEDNLVQVWTRLDQSWDGSGYKNGRYEQLWLLDLEKGEAPTCLTFEPVDHTQACWSPNGEEIAFCANRRTAPDLSATSALWVLNLASNRLRRLSPIDGVAFQPAWSPDGQTIAYYFASDASEAVNVVPWIVATDGQSAPRAATTLSARETSIETIVDKLHFTMTGRPCWYPDSSSLLVTVQTRGQVHLNRLYIKTNHEEPLTTGNGCYLSPHLSTNGRTIATLRTDWFTPGDIWTMAGNGANRRRLSAVNDTLMRNRQLIRPKKVSWRSFDQQEIEGWLYLPPLPAGVRAPLILDVHGGPNLAWAESYVHDFQVLAGLGYAVLAANPRGSAGYGEEFCHKVVNDWGGDDLRDLLAGIDHVIATEPVDSGRLAITGSSYGGYMTCWSLTQSQRFKAGIAINPVTSLLTCSRLSDQAIWFGLSMGMPGQNREAETLRSERSPLTFADAIKAPLLLLHGSDDLRCPASESRQLFSALRSRQHEVELVIYPQASHLLDYPHFSTPRRRTDRLARTIEWLKKYV